MKARVKTQMSQKKNSLLVWRGALDDAIKSEEIFHRQTRCEAAAAALADAAEQQQQKKQQQQQKQQQKNRDMIQTTRINANCTPKHKGT